MGHRPNRLSRFPKWIFDDREPALISGRRGSSTRNSSSWAVNGVAAVPFRSARGGREFAQRSATKPPLRTKGGLRGQTLPCGYRRISAGSRSARGWGKDNGCYVPSPRPARFCPGAAQASQPGERSENRTRRTLSPTAPAGAFGHIAAFRKSTVSTPQHDDTCPLWSLSTVLSCLTPS